MIAKEILAAMRKLLEDPTHWTQGVNARTATGEEVSWHDDQACTFCLNGAMCKVDPDSGDNKSSYHFQARDLIHHCIQEKFGQRLDLVDFNDAKGRKHEEILSVIDCAIEHAPEEQPA